MIKCQSLFRTSFFILLNTIIILALCSSSCEPTRKTKSVCFDTCIEDTVTNEKNLDAFLHLLAFRESTNNWKVINRFGYMGKYQLGKLALMDIDMDSITVQKFRKDRNSFPEYLQDIAIKKYIKKNKHYLRRYIKKYNNKTIKGIKVTESGMIGAAHLVGQRSVKQWLRRNGRVNKVDGNGVSLESYLMLFSGYNLSK
jgi:hypothetical protein